MASPLFYSESKDLAIVEVYFFGELPNANNLPARTDTYSSAYGGPVTITSQYEYEYDSKWNATSKMVTFGTGNKQAVFTNMNYSCQ
ncbi:MAG TPA: hypothetical protein VGQ59_08025 [Cyclobacteriaceae bacterium]|nr:hypothetical protein [Cyclobacteriaceae bacterium]